MKTKDKIMAELDLHFRVGGSGTATVIEGSPYERPETVESFKSFLSQALDTMRKDTLKKVKARLEKLYDNPGRYEYEYVIGYKDGLEQLEEFIDYLKSEGGK